MSFKKFIVGTDIHGDMQDAPANKVFFDFVSAFKPHIRVCGGDLWDFRPLRSGCNEDEKRESMAKDYVAGVNWLNKFRPHFLLRGNHDERLWELANSDCGVCSDYAQSGVVEVEAILRKMQCQMLPYHKRDGVLRLGSLKILHGFYCGETSAKRHALVYGSCLFGHIHTVDEHSIPGLERRVGRAIGCLCSTDMDYSARQPNSLRQSNGFAYGILDEKSGHYHVWQAENIGGSWILPSDFVEY